MVTLEAGTLLGLLSLAGVFVAAYVQIRERLTKLETRADNTDKQRDEMKQTIRDALT